MCAIEQHFSILVQHACLSDTRLSFGRTQTFHLAGHQVTAGRDAKAVFHPRLLLPRVTEALADTPVVLIHGPRQCGKPILARQVSFHHYRDKDAVEVDIVMESGNKLAGVEIKAAATVTAADFRGLHKLKAATGKRFVRGVVLYDGDAIASFGDGMVAVPVSMLWQRL